MGRWGLHGVGVLTVPKGPRRERGLRTRHRGAPQGGRPDGSNDLAWEAGPNWQPWGERTSYYTGFTKIWGWADRRSLDLKGQMENTQHRTPWWLGLQGTWTWYKIGHSTWVETLTVQCLIGEAPSIGELRQISCGTPCESVVCWVHFTFPCCCEPERMTKEPYRTVIRQSSPEKQN